MPRMHAPPITLTDKQRRILTAMRNGTHTPLHFIGRATIILLAADGISNKQIAQELGVVRNKVKLWRMRWAKAATETKEIETSHPTRLRSRIEDVLSDEARAGAPPTFTPEQVARIIAITCQSPAEHGVPASSWTASELARQAVKQGVVEMISPRQVGRFLKRSGFEASPQSLLAESED